jgi:pimeloyl-ACP methyl ester carboxylesterase
VSTRTRAVRRAAAEWVAGAVVFLLAAGIAVGSQRRPQEEAIARGPRPYTDQQVAFPADGARIKLAGTLSLPNGTGPFPAVVLIAAAGPEGRDEQAGSHLVFVVLADHLLRQGIAVLRYDKRGVGASAGDFGKATFADLVSDAHDAFRYLASRPELDRRRLGAIGHSEGGSIAPAVAAVDHDVAFVVAMAGSGLSGEFRVCNHEAYLAQLDGASPEQQAKVRDLCTRIFRAVAATPDATAAAARISTLIDAAVAAKLIKSRQEHEMREILTPASVRVELTDFPLEYLKKVAVPVLALVGSLDKVVPAGPYAGVMRPVLANIPGSRLEVLPNLNHMMQTAQTGSFTEFDTIEETVAPLALRTVGDWIASQTQGATHSANPARPTRSTSP